jgi:hypothetical protein
MTDLVVVDLVFASHEKRVVIFLDFKAAYNTPTFRSMEQGLQVRGIIQAWVELLTSVLLSGASASVVISGPET